MTGIRLRGGPNAEQASPFLQRVIAEMKRCGFKPGRQWGIDLGAGNGRNAAWLEDVGFIMRAFDPEPASPRVQYWNGRSWPPVNGHTFNIILLQYVLMFVDPRLRRHLTTAIDMLARFGTVLVVETYKAKGSFYQPGMLHEWISYLNEASLSSGNPGEWVSCYNEGQDHIALQLRRIER